MSQEKVVIFSQEPGTRAVLRDIIDVEGGKPVVDPEGAITREKARLLDRSTGAVIVDLPRPDTDEEQRVLAAIQEHLIDTGRLQSMRLVLLTEPSLNRRRPLVLNNTVPGSVDEDSQIVAINKPFEIDQLTTAIGRRTGANDAS